MNRTLLQVANILEELNHKLYEARALISLLEDEKPFNKVLKSLFTDDNRKMPSEFVTPYQPIVAGIQVGFENDAEVRLYRIPKYDVHISPPGYDSAVALEVDDIRKSRFLTLEFRLDGAAYQSAKRFLFSIAGFGTWGLRGECKFRLFRKRAVGGDSGWHDVPLLRFELGETRTVANGSCAFDIPSFDDIDDAMPGMLILFLEPRNFQSQIHYVTADFEA